jgi:RHS repeat-associated protein
VATSGLLVRKVLPTGDATALIYNRQGEVEMMADANGNVHQYLRDRLGRVTDDAVPTLGPGVDGAVRRLSSGYDVRGRLQSIRSHSDFGVVLNEVKFDYNGIDCLTVDIQSHAGAVDVDTPRVQYTCTGAVDAVLRRKTVVYPNGRIVAYEYGDTNGIDDVLNRVQSMHDEDLTVLAEFRCLGAGTPAVTVLSEPGLERRWKALAGQPVGDAGDPYTGYDRFGRVENMLWWKPSTSTAAVQVGWGYDRASRRTWRRDVLADAALPAGGDQAFTYDALSQVRGRTLGRLNTNATAIGGIPAQQEAFRYDEAGNWLGYELLANGAPQIEQTRVSNRSNQLVQVDGSSAGLSYDANGNMLTVPTGDDLTGEPRRLEWDAWNRLRRVYNNGGTLMAEYEYDAQARRIVVRQAGEEARQIYYNDSWRSVEERQAVPPPPPSSSSSSSSSSGSSVPVPVVQHVWQPASRWEMLLRDRATTPGDALDERSYPLKDMLDVVALSDAGGAVIERYSYSAFGGTTFMNASFEERSVSAYGWEFLFHAEFRDADTGWYNYGYRYYSTELGRWLARDPIGEKGGINLYVMVGNDAVNWMDVLGLDTCKFRILVERIVSGCHVGTLSTITAFCCDKKVWSGVGREPAKGDGDLQPTGKRTNTRIRSDGKWGPEFKSGSDPRSPVFQFGGGPYQIHPIPYSTQSNPLGEEGPDGTHSRSSNQIPLTGLPENTGEGCTWIGCKCTAYPDGAGGASLYLEDSRTALQQAIAEYEKCCPSGGDFTTEYVDKGGTFPINYYPQQFPNGLPPTIDDLPTTNSLP